MTQCFTRSVTAISAFCVGSSEEFAKMGLSIPKAPGWTMSRAGHVGRAQLVKSCGLFAALLHQSVERVPIGKLVCTHLALPHLAPWPPTAVSRKGLNPTLRCVLGGNLPY